MILMGFFDETMQGLLEAAEIKDGTLTLSERKDFFNKTYYVPDETIVSKKKNILESETKSIQEES